MTAAAESGSRWRHLRRAALTRVKILLLVCLTATFLAHLLLTLSPGGLSAAQGSSRPVTGYFIWLWGVLRLDLGFTNRGLPVESVVAHGLAVTVPLLAGAILTSVVSALGPVLLRLSRSGRAVGLGLGQLVLLVSFIPVVLLGYFIVLYWVHRFGEVPSLGLAGSSPMRAASAVLLPALVLGLGDGTAAELLGLTRVLVREGIKLPFVQAVRAKGASIPRHLFRYLLGPMVASVLGRIPLLLGGAIVVESVFTLPGIGFLTWRAAAERDAPLIMGVTLVLVLASELAVGLGDILFSALDPRAREGRA